MGLKQPTIKRRRFNGNSAEMAMRGRLGGLAKSARHDAVEGTALARQAFLSKFEREVDPDGLLPEEERHRRAAAARKLHFANLATASARKRRKADGREQLVDPETNRRLERLEKAMRRLLSAVLTQSPQPLSEAVVKELWAIHDDLEREAQ